MRRKYLKLLGVSLLLVLILVWGCNQIIYSSAKGKTFSDVNEVPQNRVGLILGTSNRLANGQENLYYTFRIQATVALFKANKINFVLVSGDNATIYYNEPSTIKNDLIKYGIPEEKIFLDYAGFRTLDSMVRAKTVFGLNEVTLISQQFHNERAIYLAEKKGLKAIGYNARDVDGKNGFKVHFREYFARVKVFLDLLLNTQPKF
ncbi:MAG: ElyC/SanA/YdcF family protein, partial [Bacteroidota bacterium]